MEKRAVLAIVLSLAVVLVWSIFFAPAPTPPPSEVSDSAPGERPAGAPQQDTAPAVESVSPAAGTTERPAVPLASHAALVTVDTGVARFTLTSQGAGVKAVQLHAYRTTLAKGAPPIEIAPVPGSAMVPLTAELHLGQQVTSLGQVAFTPSQTALTLSASQPEGTIDFRGELGDGLTVHRLYRFHYTNYTFEVRTWIEGLQPPAESSMLLLWGPGLLRHTDDVGRQGQTAEQARSYVSGKILHEAPKKAGEKQVEQGQVAWTALADTYFAAVLMPREPAGEAVIAQRLEGDALEIGLRTPLNPDRTTQTVRVYVGPKSQPLLEAAEPSLDKLIDLGFFSPLARPMLQFLRLLNGLVHNYGVTIMLATLLIKIAFWPLTQTSYKSMQAMQKLQPRIKELQVVYKDDRQAQQRATMQLYREHKVNPMGGCLPMVLQIPVFFAFYNALLYAIELRHAPFICWGTELWWIGRGICDLSVHDPSYVTPVLMGITMFVQQKMTPTTGDPAQAKVMQFMPLIFLMFFLKAPAGLVIYWLMNNVLSIAQQLMINRSSAPAVAKTEVARKG